MPGYSKRRTDNNHREIIIELRSHGFSVFDTHNIPKFVDCVVGYNGYNFMFEIKQDHKKKLTPDEQKLKDTWTGQYDVITSAKEAITIIYNRCPPF